MDYAALTTADLVSAFNAAFDKNVKVGSYTRTRMIEALQAREAQPTEPTFASDGAPDNWAAEPLTETPVEIEVAPITFEEGEGPRSTDYPAPAPTTEEEEAKLLIEVRLVACECPLCGADAADQTRAGEDGTFLGDCARTCHNCGSTYNNITGEEIPDAPAGKTKKRRILNPQGKIDAKADELKKNDFTLFYDRPSRIWIISSDRDDELETIHMASREFAEHTPASLLSLAVFKIRPQ